MFDLNAYLEAGNLELYVLGNLTEPERKEVEEYASIYPEVAQELLDISKALEAYAQNYAVAPDITLKPTILSTIDFIERMQNGEPVSYPPTLHTNSVIADYAEWLDRKDMVLPNDFEDIFGKVISHTEQSTLAIIWLKYGSPTEVHTDKLESFLIVEGSCIITIEDEEHLLYPGDVLSIPLYKNHFVKVTSSVACKVILQRLAA